MQEHWHHLSDQFRAVSGALTALHCLWSQIKPFETCWHLLLFPLFPYTVYVLYHHPPPPLLLNLLHLWVTDWVQWQPQQESHTDAQQSAETLADAASAAWAHLLWRITRRISFSCRVYRFFCAHVVCTYAMWLQHKQKEDLGFAGIWGKVKSVWVCMCATSLQEYTCAYHFWK